MSSPYTRTHTIIHFVCCALITAKQQPFPDSSFLLRFLRAKKFSVPITREAIERYLLLRHSYDMIFTNLDINLPTMKTLIDLGYVKMHRIVHSMCHASSSVSDSVFTFCIQLSNLAVCSVACRYIGKRHG